MLEVRGLTKSFGALRATDGIDLEVREGETHAIIGPNGAGKTTFIGQLAGNLRPDGGRILFAGEDITHLPAPRRARKGLARSFQITSIYPEFSALHNVALAVQPRLLLLDEPMAGMGAEESQRMIGFLGTLKRRHTMILVEHDMDAVF